MSDRPMIFVVSDATGHTAENVVRAAMLQFGRERGALRLFPQTRSVAAVEEVVGEALGARALVVYTLVNSELRGHLQRRAQQEGLGTVDLLSPLLFRLQEHLGSAPQEKPGLLHRMDEDYFRRIEAVEFAIHHDDGQNTRAIRRADVVLVGVSRTSKTPVSAVLAGKGLRVANVPLVLGVTPPPELLSLPRGRVYALTIAPLKLLAIRRRRMEQAGVAGEGAYTDRSSVEEEVRWALRLFRANPHWPVIDVTHLAVEETAAAILQRRAQVRAGDGDGDGER